MTRKFSSTWILAFIVALVFVARLLLAMRFDLIPDETLYAWQSATNPFSFCPHPPLTLLMVKAGIAIFGKTALGVRFFPLLLNTLSVVPMFLLAREVGNSQKTDGSNVAFWSVLAFLAAPIYFALGAITTPDVPQLFFWLCGLLCVWRAFDTNQMRWWIATGIAVGVGLFVKYILILFFPALFLTLLLAPQWRPYLKTFKPYVAVLVALLLFVPPFLHFEYSNHWMTLGYHLGSRQNRQWPNAHDILSYQGIHAAYYSPLLYVGLICGTVWALRRGREKRDASLIFLGCFAAVPWLFFSLIASLTERGLSREQWDAPSYLAAMIAAVLMAHFKIAESQTQSAWRKWRAAAISLGFALSLVVVSEATLTVFSRVLGKAPFLSNLVYTHDMARQIDARIVEQRAQPNGFRPDFTVGDNFTSALAYAFYGKEIARFYTSGREFNAGYGLVGVLKPIEIDDAFLARERGRNALFFSEDAHPSAKSPPSIERQRQRLQPCFASVTLEKPLDIFYQKHFVTRFYVWQCRGLRKTPSSWIATSPN